MPIARNQLSTAIFYDGECSEAVIFQLKNPIGVVEWSGPLQERRWIVERTNSWLGQFRRLLVRHEHLLSTYRAFFYLACFWITLRHCL